MPLYAPNAYHYAPYAADEVRHIALMPMLSAAMLMMPRATIVY